MKKEKPVPLQELEMRDFFAAFAVIQLLATKDRPWEDYAFLAYKMADALMEERKK